MQGKSASGAGRGEDFAAALASCRQLRAIFHSSKGGSKDLRSLQRVRELCARATRSISDSVYRDRLGQLQNFADALFSDRRNQQWARYRSTAGVLSLRERVNATLDSLDARLHLLMVTRKLPPIRARRQAPVATPLQPNSG